VKSGTIPAYKNPKYTIPMGKINTVRGDKMTSSIRIFSGQKRKDKLQNGG
jgi:hypothetical protein